ncbi:MAG: type II secretion system protein GspM [Alphaproteobacteria bacterium]
MIIRVREWYRARTRREQWLIVAMVGIALPLFIWLAIVLPLANAYQAAHERHLQAIDRHGRILTLAKAIEAEPSRARLNRNIDLQLLVTEAAGAAGIALGDVNPSGAESISLTIANTAAPAATEWLRGLEARGLSIQELRITPAGEGVVNVSARLARR